MASHRTIGSTGGTTGASKPLDDGRREEGNPRNSEVGEGEIDRARDDHDR